MRSAMPDRIYRGRTPHTWLDHFLAHPWEIAISLWSAFIGAATLITTLLRSDTTASSSVAQLPNVLIYALAAMLVGGAAQTLRGLFNDDPDMMIGFAHERVGLVLVGTAWLVYAVAVIAAFPDAISSWTSGLTLAAASALRLAATLRDERTLRGRP